MKSDEEIGEKLNQFDFRAGKRLADILLSDILPELPKDTPLLIVPSGCLGVLSFESLVLNDGGKIVSRTESLRFPEPISSETATPSPIASPSRP